MTGSKQKEVTTTEQAVEVSKQINDGSVDFLGMEKMEVDDMQLDRQPTKKTLSQVAKQTLLTDHNSVANLLEAAEKIGEETGSEQIKDAEYWSPELGEVLNVIVTGFLTTVIDKKHVKVVCFKNKKNENFIAGAITLVKAMEKIENELPAVIRIVVKEKVNGENGKYFTFDIFRL